MAAEIDSQTSTPVAYIENLRRLVRDYIDKHQYESALFWADKVVSLSNNEVGDLYWYAQTLYLTGQFHRAGNLLKTHKLDKKYLACRYLAARCHYDCKEWQESLDLLDQDVLLGGTNKTATEQSCPNIPHQKVESSINLLRGKVYEAMDNRNLAAECFREALRGDVYCTEAFDSLVSHHMLTAQEERELLDSLPFKVQCSEEEVELLKFLYENKLKKYHKPSELAVPSKLERLNSNLEVVVAEAERLYYNCDFRECHKITVGVLNKDPYNSHCLPLHIAVLVELGKSNTLFYLAHKLVDLYPNKAVAWFAVGCYYLLIGKNDPARRYLSKASTLDRVYGPAWLAFGHSFAAENEHDQAMAAYFTASQLMKGCHLPVLYIGLEYGLTNNTKLAERFFTQALNIAPEDPFVLHEMGVIAFQNKDYEQSEKYLRSALDKVCAISQDVLVERWEPLLNNLGHTCRKLRKYDEALEFHRQALILVPKSCTTLSAIGFVYALSHRSEEAVDYFHKALGLRRDDTFTTTVLLYCLENLTTDLPPCEGVPEVLPKYTYEGKLDMSHPSEAPTPDSLSPVLTSGGGESSNIDSSNLTIEMDLEDP